MSGEVGIFEELFDVPGGSLEVEGIDNMVSVCTHWGWVTLQIGSVTRRIKGYYCPTETTTIVPGAQLDNGDWWAAQKDRTLLLFKNNQLRARFPRAQ